MIMNSPPVHRSTSHGGVGQVSTTARTNSDMNTSSDPTRLNM